MIFRVYICTQEKQLMEAGNHLRGSTSVCANYPLPLHPHAGSVTPLYYTNETLYMIRAKYLVFHLAKTQQNIILDV